MNAVLSSELTLSLAIFVTGVAVIDIRSHRIPNVLVLLALNVAMGLQIYDEGVVGLLIALNGFLVGLILFLPFYIRRVFGAGDVKAMAAVGAFLGPVGIVMAVAFTLIAGAVMGVLILLSRGGLGAIEALRQRWMLRLMVLVSIGPGGPAIAPSANDAASQRFPYGCAIAVGTLAALWLNGSLSLAIATVLGH